MSVESVYNFIGSRYVMAPGAIIKVGPFAGVNAFSVKIVGTGGTLEVGGYSLTADATGFTVLAGSAAWTQSGGQTFGTMYPISANEVFSANFAGNVYLYNTGATTTVGIAFGQSQGY